MPPVALLGAGMVGASAISSNQQKKAAKGAANAQVEATNQGIAEQRRQFDKMQELLKPYVESSGEGLSSMMGLMGLSGQEAQQEQIDAIREGAEFNALNEVGDEAILANASATGGLRGGNTQTALARFHQQNLSDLINKQMSRFGGLAQMGQSSAAGVGAAGMSMGNNIAQMRVNQGEALGSAAIARGNANAAPFNMAGSLAGIGFGKRMGMF